MCWSPSFFAFFLFILCSLRSFRGWVVGKWDLRCVSVALNVTHWYCHTVGFEESRCLRYMEAAISVALISRKIDQPLMRRWKLIWASWRLSVRLSVTYTMSKRQSWGSSYYQWVTRNIWQSQNVMIPPYPIEDEQSIIAWRAESKYLISTTLRENSYKLSLSCSLYRDDSTTKNKSLARILRLHWHPVLRHIVLYYIVSYYITEVVVMTQCEETLNWSYYVFSEIIFE